MMILFILALISLIVVVGFVVKNRRETHENGQHFRVHILVRRSRSSGVA